MTEILPDDRYLQMLDAKLNEELAEYRESKSLEELADPLEVMRAVVKTRGWTWEQLEQVRHLTCRLINHSGHRGFAGTVVV